MQTPNNAVLQISTEVNELLENDYLTLCNEAFNANVSEKIAHFLNNTKDYIYNNNPYENHRRKLTFAELDFKTHGGCEETIKSDLVAYRDLIPDVNTSFWEGKLKLISKESRNESLIKKNLDSLRRNTQEVWRKDYEAKLLEWQLNEIEKLRNTFLNELKEWFETLKQLQEVTASLGLETGVLWDISSGTLSKQDFSILKQWAEYLKNDEGVKNLCDLMGRLQKEQASHKRDIINSTLEYSATIPDINGKEEIVGIELGRDLENVIPQELALLSNPEVALLFDLKYAENRLMCFSKQGYKSKNLERLVEEEVTVIENDTKGPIIICIDTSGSMRGAPENIAKAITLALSSRANAENRKCYLINFSTSIDTLDLSPPQGIKDLIDFLRMSFHGGTDVTPALVEGLRMMTESEFRKSDLLVISDFVLDEIPKKTISLSEQQKTSGNRFFSLSIGNFRLNQNKQEDFFDQTWTYNPRSGSISELNNILEKI